MLQELETIRAELENPSLEFPDYYLKVSLHPTRQSVIPHVTANASRVFLSATAI